MRLGLAHEQKRAHICSRREAATDQAEVIEVIPLTRVKLAADCWPLEKVLSAVVHDAAAHACSM